jgi:hypothetical protein
MILAITQKTRKASCLGVLAKFAAVPAAASVAFASNSWCELGTWTDQGFVNVPRMKIVRKNCTRLTAGRQVAHRAKSLFRRANRRSKSVPKAGFLSWNQTLDCGYLPETEDIKITAHSRGG